MIYNHTNRVINETTFKLLVQNGYDKLTYQKIATSCGVERALVQYYFPKKQNIASDFFIYTWDLAAEFVESVNPPVTGQKASVWVSCLHYSFLVSTEKLRELTLELIDSRRVTDGFSDLLTERSIALVNLNFDEERTLLVRNINRKLVGSLLDDLYHRLSLHEEVSGKQISNEYAHFFLAEDGLTKEQANRFLEENEMPDELLSKGVAYIADSLNIDHPELDLIRTA